MKRTITVTHKVQKEVEIDLTSTYYQKKDQYFYKIDGDVVTCVDTTLIPPFGYFPEIRAEKLERFIDRMADDVEAYTPCNQIDFINALSKVLKDLKL